MSDPAIETTPTSSSLAYVYHPRGYRRVVSLGVHEAHYEPNTSAARKLGRPVMEAYQGNDKVNELRNDIDRKYLFYTDWAYIEQTMYLAATLLPDLYQFIAAQQDNRRVQDHAWQFLHDICEFSRTGRAPMHPWNRFELIEDWPGSKTIETKRAMPKRPIVTYRDSYAAQRPIANILSHEGGVEYLVIALYTLFGGPRY